MVLLLFLDRKREMRFDIEKPCSEDLVGRMTDMVTLALSSQNYAEISVESE